MSFVSSHGWRCEPCFHEGILQAKREDGSLLSEADRCQGCGETICDRHVQPPQAEDHADGWNFHFQRTRFKVTEVTQPKA